MVELSVPVHVEAAMTHRASAFGTTQTLIVEIVVLLLASGCGGGGTSSSSNGAPPPAAVAVTISPTSVTLRTGATQQFTATVTGTPDTSVTWAVNGIIAGNPNLGIVSTGGLYTAPTTAPNPNTVTVTATSAADTSKIASASVTITTAPVVTVTVSPTSANLQTGATQQFTATVTGTSNTSVIWTVNGVTGGNLTTGTISMGGLYTAPATAPNPNIVTVTATSAADTSKFASASVTITTAPVMLDVTGSWSGTMTNSTCTFQWLANLTQSGSIVTGQIVVAGSGQEQSIAPVTGTLNGDTLSIAGPTQIPTSFTGVVTTTGGNPLAWSGTFLVSAPNVGLCGSGSIQQGTFQGTGGLPPSPPSSVNVTGSWSGTMTNSTCTFQWLANLTQSGSSVTGQVVVTGGGQQQSISPLTGTVSGSTLWIAGPEQIPTSFTGVVTTTGGNPLAWSGTFLVSAPNVGLCGSNPIQQGAFQGTG